MSAEVFVAIAANRIIAFAAVSAGGFTHKARVNQFHRRKIRVAQRGHNLQQAVLFANSAVGHAVNS